MNGIDNITDKILKDAQTEADAVIAAAEKEAQAIIDSAKAQAKEESEAIIKASNDKETVIIEHISDTAELEGKKLILRAKQEMLDEIFKEAFSRLKNLKDQEYILFLSKMAAQASLSGTEEIILSDKDKSKVGAQVLKGANELLSQKGKKAALVLSSAARNIDGGLILKAGDIETNCSLDVLYNIIRSDMAAETAVKLFN